MNYYLFHKFLRPVFLLHPLALNRQKNTSCRQICRLISIIDHPLLLLTLPVIPFIRRSLLQVNVVFPPPILHLALLIRVIWVFMFFLFFLFLLLVQFRSIQFETFFLRKLLIMVSWNFFLGTNRLNRN